MGRSRPFRPTLGGELICQDQMHDLVRLLRVWEPLEVGRTRRIVRQRRCNGFAHASASYTTSPRGEHPCGMSSVAE